MRPLLLATALLGAVASAALADPAAADPATSARSAAPAAPVELSDEQMDRVSAGGSRVATSSSTREST